MILNSQQAAAVFAAMVAANKVDGVVTVVMPCASGGPLPGVIRVHQDHPRGGVYVSKTGVHTKTEGHLGQAAFVKFYGLGN